MRCCAGSSVRSRGMGASFHGIEMRVTPVWSRAHGPCTDVLQDCEKGSFISTDTISSQQWDPHLNKINFLRICSALVEQMVAPVLLKSNNQFSLHLLVLVHMQTGTRSPHRLLFVDRKRPRKGANNSRGGLGVVPHVSVREGFMRHTEPAVS